MAPRKVTSTVAAAPASEWDSMEDAYLLDARPSNRAVDVEAETPDPIKEKVSVALEDSVEKSAARYRTQRLKSAEQAEEFVKLARRYAKFCGWSFKGGVVSDTALNVLVQKGNVAADTPVGTVVSFAVVVEEEKVTRKRLSDDDRKEIVKLFRSKNADIPTLVEMYEVSRQTIRKVLTDAGIVLPDQRKK